MAEPIEVEIISVPPHGMPVDSYPSLPFGLFWNSLSVSVRLPNGEELKLRSTVKRSILHYYGHQSVFFVRTDSELTSFSRLLGQGDNWYLV